MSREGCNLQVAGQNLEKELIPKTEQYKDVLVPSIIFLKGSRKIGNITSQFYKLIL